MAAELAKAEAEAKAAEEKALNDAATLVISRWRRFTARRNIRLLVQQVYEKIWDDQRRAEVRSRLDQEKARFLELVTLAETLEGMRDFRKERA